MTSRFIVVIPARYASTRLPGKPLVEIAGKPMIEWVFRQAAKSGAAEVIVATDDQRIAAACRAFGAPVELTSPEHASGTDRIAELARRFEWPDGDIVVNVQGDEPLISPACIAQAAQLLDAHPQAAIATLVAPLTAQAEFSDPNFVKVVTDKDGWALYFSRAPIPFVREGSLPRLRHVGVYGFARETLLAVPDLPSSGLAETESLEQLRFLENDIPMHVLDARGDPRGIETRADYDAFLRRLQTSREPR